MSLWSKTLLAASAIAYVPVYGTLTPELSFAELVAQSEVVAHGRVVGSSVAWDVDHAVIWTSYEIRVDDAMKGEPGSSIVIQEPGGELDGVAMSVAGAPRYRAGEEVIVFAARAPLGLRTCGWGQGRFVVEATASGKRVRNDLGGIQLVSPQGRRRPHRAVPPAGGDLMAFKQRIRAEVQRQFAPEAVTAP